MNKPIRKTAYGREVWTNKKMDSLRRVECLCLNCSEISGCSSASKLYSLCKTKDLAMMITRCPNWTKKEG